MPAVKESALALPAATIGAGKPSAGSKSPNPDIIDIRGKNFDSNLKDEIRHLISKEGERKLPLALLYNERGLQLFEEITYTDEYYVTDEEIEILQKHAAEVAEIFPAGSILVELGSGSLRKVSHLLQAFEDLERPIDYFALDLSEKELYRTLSHLPQFNHVACHGLLGTFDDGREWLEQAALVQRPKGVLYLGSSLGNLPNDEAIDFLRCFNDILRPTTDFMLVGLDLCSNPEKVYRAYHDEIEADFVVRQGLYLLQRNALPFTGVPTLYAAEPLPALQDWDAVWEAWDMVSRQMLPQQGLTEKPIRLRNACIFYLGHIPAFLDIQLSKATLEGLTEPSEYTAFFERGIDPDVDNPENCHAHSAIPDEWPPVEQILAYHGRVRDRLRRTYLRHQDAMPRCLARAIWIGFEHVLMHIETLLYMLLQSDRTLPPSHTTLPDFEAMAEKAFKNRSPNRWYDIPEQTILLGMDDPEGDESPGYFGWDNEKPCRKQKVHAFKAAARPITNEEYAQYMYDKDIKQAPASWSCETTSGLELNGNGNSTARRLKNGSTSFTTIPDSFLRGKTVRTVYGLVPLKLALDWPVCASYDELAGCASWMGGRIPTFEEVRSIYSFVEDQKKEVSTKSRLAKKVPAVNGHLVNDGVQETPPPNLNSVVYGSASSELFVDLSDANVGFRHWHPIPVTARGESLAGQAGMGGLWEWTSSTLRPHPGFAPMPLYPGYTADFFDDKHNIVLGGSWATHPRIAGRKSFVNWYQRNYLYAWVGARLVKDII